MSLEKWAEVQEALEERFSGGADSSIGGQWLGRVLDQERDYGAILIRTYRGFSVMESAFFDFFIESLRCAASGAFRGQLPKTDQHYIMLYITYLSLFRGFRAASILKNCGYPLNGFAALRDLKNRAIHIGAVINGMTDILAIHGVDPTREGTDPITMREYKKIRVRRSQEQSFAISRMVGKESGLSPSDIREMELLRDMYHDEVHGGLFTFIHDFKTIVVDKRLPSVGPWPHEKNFDASSYMSRATEVGWMVLRSMPYLQLTARAFGDDWAERWKLLDDAFRMQVEGLGQLGKEIGHVVPRIMAAKFPFDPEWHYNTSP